MKEKETNSEKRQIKLKILRGPTGRGFCIILATNDMIFS